MITLLIDAGFAARADDRRDVALDHLQVARLQRADVDDHVDFGCAVEDRPAGLVVLHVGGRGAERKADDRADADAASRAAAATQSATQAGLTQTVAKWNSAASRHSFSISCRVASGLSSV